MNEWAPWKENKEERDQRREKRGDGDAEKSSYTLLYE